MFHCLNKNCLPLLHRAVLSSLGGSCLTLDCLWKPQYFCLEIESMTFPCTRSLGVHAFHWACN